MTVFRQEHDATLAENTLLGTIWCCIDQCKLEADISATLSG